MSASRVSSESSRARPCSVSWTSCRADSSRSSMISSAGANWCSWRQSSEPMEPPAPVTRMRLPAKCPAIAATSVRTGRRPSRSLILGSRTPSIRAPPLISSVTVGTTLGVSPHSSARAVRSRIAVPLDLAIAITSTVAPVAAATSAILIRLPRTGIPCTRSRRLSGSSSRSATGRYAAPGSPSRRADQHCARLAGPEHDDLDARLRRPLFAPPGGVPHVTGGGDRRQRDERPPGDGLHQIPLTVDQQAAQQEQAGPASGRRRWPRRTPRRGSPAGAGLGRARPAGRTSTTAGRSPAPRRPAGASRCRRPVRR